MAEADDTVINKNREVTIPPWDAVSITRQRAEDSRDERDHAIEELRKSMSEEQILTELGIDLMQIEG